MQRTGVVSAPAIANLERGVTAFRADTGRKHEILVDTDKPPVHVESSRLTRTIDNKGDMMPRVAYNIGDRHVRIIPLCDFCRDPVLIIGKGVLRSKTAVKPRTGYVYLHRSRSLGS